MFTQFLHGVDNHCFFFPVYDYKEDHSLFQETVMLAFDM